MTTCSCNLPSTSSWSVVLKIGTPVLCFVFLTSGVLTAAGRFAPSSWAPPDIDQRVPPARSDTPCPLPRLLHESGLRAQELVNNLQRFSARDKTEEQELHKNAHTGVLKTATFNYLAVIDHAKSGTPIVDEYRVRTTSYENMQLMDTGTAAFALIFHPRNLPDYAVTCEGLTELEGRHAWQLHFAQYPDRDNQFHVYVVENKFYPTRLKGRVWISADDYHLLRMETDLLQPIEQIHLQREHSIIRYGPVEFHKRNLQLWLPQTTELYVDYHRHHFVRRHRFSNFQLFWVETEQQINRTIPGNAHLLGGQL